MNRSLQLKGGVVNRKPIKEFKLKDVIPSQTFYVSHFSVLEKKNGKGKYGALVLSDKTATITGKAWDYPTYSDEIKALFKPDTYIDLSGEVGEWQGNLQFTVKGVSAAKPAPNPEDFEKVSKFDPHEMLRTFEGYLDSFEDPRIKSVAQKIHYENVELFFKKPAATGMHHAFRHGLLEHTVQMLQSADKLFELPCYADELNKDLCMFGVMFHDYCKIFEYGDGPGFRKTVDGILVGHIPMIGSMVYHEGLLLGLPRPLILHLMSVVLSHHGKVEWGSPTMPATPEGVFVHHVDNLHGSVFGALQKMEDTPGEPPLIEYGYGDGKLNLVAKRFTDLLKEMREQNGQGTDRITEVFERPTGEDAEVGGF